MKLPPIPEVLGHRASPCHGLFGWSPPFRKLAYFAALISAVGPVKVFMGRQTRPRLPEPSAYLGSQMPVVKLPLLGSMYVCVMVRVPVCAESATARSRR